MEGGRRGGGVNRTTLRLTLGPHSHELNMHACVCRNVSVSSGHERRADPGRGHLRLQPVVRVDGCAIWQACAPPHPSNLCSHCCCRRRKLRNLRGGVCQTVDSTSDRSTNLNSFHGYLAGCRAQMQFDTCCRRYAFRPNMLSQ